MRDGAIFSGILHGVVILLLLIGFPELFRRQLEPPPVIPIDIINISDMTSAPALKVKPKDNTLEEDPKEKPKPPKPMPVADKTPEPEPEEKVEPEKTPEPELTMDDLLAPVKDEKPKEEEKPKEKPKDKPKKPKKKKKSAFDSLMKNLDKTKSASEGKTQPEQDESSTADHAANNISDVLSVSEMDLLSRQMKDHWNIVSGKDAREISVVVRVEMAPDGVVRAVTFISANKPESAAYVKQSIDAAIRAVWKASPLKYPREKYESLKTFQYIFTPPQDAL